MPPRKAIQSKRTRPAVELRRDALKRLEQQWTGEDGEIFDPSSEPTVTPLLKSVDGGIEHVLEALRAHDDADSKSFIDLYDDLSQKDRQLLTLEEIAYAAGIGSLRLAEVATSATILHGQMRVKLLLSAGMPRVVETMLRQAVKPKGLADREWALKSGNVLPIPKGAQIAIQNNLSAPKEDTVVEAEPQYLDAGERLRMIHAAVEPRRLPSPPSEPFDAGGRLDHMQADVAEVISGDV